MSVICSNKDASVQVSRLGNAVALRAALIALSLCLATQTGLRSGTQAMLVPFLFFTMALAIVVVVTRPSLVLWLIPVGIAIPRSVPRLANQLGLLELTLVLGGLALTTYLLNRRHPFYIDVPLKLMLLITAVISASWLIRGDIFGFTRSSTWVGATLIYALTINLVPGKYSPYRLLGIAAIVVIGLLTLDVLLKGVNPYEVGWAVYRLSATTVGYGNFAMALMMVVLPVPLIYGQLASRRDVRWFFLLVFVGGTAIALTFLSRIVVLHLSVSTVAMGVALLRHNTYSKTSVVFTMTILLISPFTLIRLLYPDVITLLSGRFESMFYYQDPRVDIWLGLLERAAYSPLWGYGAVNSFDLFQIHGGHGLLPEMLFEYGLIMMVPFVALLTKWLLSSWRLVNQPELTANEFAFAVASFGIITGVIIVTSAVGYLYTHPAYTGLVTFAMGLLAVQESGKDG